MDDSGFLFDATGLERAKPLDDGGVEVGAGINKRFGPYDPRLMLRVLLYGYCVGVRSSRELERACVEVVAFR